MYSRRYFMSGCKPFMMCKPLNWIRVNFKQFFIAYADRRALVLFVIHTSEYIFSDMFNITSRLTCSFIASLHRFCFIAYSVNDVTLRSHQLNFNDPLSSHKTVISYHTAATTWLQHSMCRFLPAQKTRRLWRQTVNNWKKPSVEWN